MKNRVLSFITLLLVIICVVPSFQLETTAALYGDVDKSGVVDIADARMIIRAAVGLETLDNLQKSVCDNSGDGKITALDGRIVLKRVLDGADDIAYPTSSKYSGEIVSENGTYSATDDLDRVLDIDVATPSGNEDKTVGLFYFLNLGQHGGSASHDISKIIARDPQAPYSEEAWIAAGGGEVGEIHFWGEPLFGYYHSNDAWVYRKHLQMLTDADIDYIIFDATNAYYYFENFLVFVDVWHEYYAQGIDVPKFAFYTNSYSKSTMTNIFLNCYSNSSLKSQYENYSDMWFKWDGKPLIIGIESEAPDYMKDFFTIKESVWPNSSRSDNGWPWMEFGRLYTSSAVYGENGRKEVVNVSVAQHCNSVTFSATAWYGYNDHTRSWRRSLGRNDTSANAVLYGYNFQDQWDWALTKNPETIFVTGWNEWQALRQPVKNGIIAYFVDCCEINTSRDIEPMAGGYGDNYYIQLIDNVRRYKGTSGRVDTGDYVTIDIDGSFDQWNNEKITAKYTDYLNDTANRNNPGYDGITYTDTTGRNDIVLAKVCKNKTTAFFYLETADDIELTSSGSLTLFLSTDKSGTKRWYGYDYSVNVTASGATISACTANDTWGWTSKGALDMKLEGNKLMIAVPLSYLGCTYNNGNETINLSFKWADNYQKVSGVYDIWSFYKFGDAAPYGRLNFVYSDKPE